MNCDFLYYGGCFILQTGNISLALTDSIGQAMEASSEMGLKTEPYWTTYTVHFANQSEYEYMLKLIKSTCGLAYLAPFVANFNEQELSLGGFCLI